MEIDRCEDLRAYFVAWLTGQASKEVELRIRLHLAEGCGACSGELQALYEAFHAVPLAYPPQPLLEGSVPLLTRKIAAMPQESREVPIVYPESPGQRLAWVLVALFAVALAVAGFWGRGHVARLEQARERLAFQESQARRSAGQYHDLRERAGRIEARVAMLSDPRITGHDLPSGEGGMRLRAFVGMEDGTVALVAAGLQAPPPGRRLLAWWGNGGAWTLLGEMESPPETWTTFDLPAGAALPSRIALSSSASDESPPPPSDVILEGTLGPSPPAGDSPDPGRDGGSEVVQGGTPSSPGEAPLAP